MQIILIRNPIETPLKRKHPLENKLNMVERNYCELKRRTKVATLFTSEKSIERLVSALLMEQDESWIGEKLYLNIKEK